MGREKVAMRGVSRDALVALGLLIREHRVKMAWPQKRLGQVAGMSERTVVLIERGEPSVSIGNVFNAAAAVGVPLFAITDPHELARKRHRGEEITGLLPQRVVQEKISAAERDF